MPDLSADHRIILARITGGWVEWGLECTHAPDDPKFHHYCEDCNEPSCVERKHHDECIVHPWWNEEGIELVTDIDGPIVAPIPVRAVPHGEWWRLEAVPTEVGQTDAERYLAERLKDPEYRAAYTVAALTRAAELLTAAYLSEGK